MGYSEARGDTISVVNSAFVPEKIENLPDLPIWRNPDIVEPAKDFGRIALGVIVLFFLYQRALKPMVTRLIEALSPQEEVYQPQAALLADDSSAMLEPPTQQEAAVARNYADNLAQAKALAMENPKLVANVVSSWIAGAGNG
jgi:flagellar M-ring protein FliF